MRRDIDIKSKELETGSEKSIDFVRVIRPDGTKARVWFSVRFNNSKVEAIMTVRKKNGKDVTMRAIADWHEDTVIS